MLVQPRELPPELGGPPLKLDDAPHLPLLNRTAIPQGWCTGDVLWERLLARRWARPLQICEGETRAAVAWARIMARVAQFHNTEVFDLVDNLGAVGLLSR